MAFSTPFRPQRGIALRRRPRKSIDKTATTKQKAIAGESDCDASTAASSQYLSTPITIEVTAVPPVINVPVSVPRESKRRRSCYRRRNSRQQEELLRDDMRELQRTLELLRFCQLSDDEDSSESSCEEEDDILSF